MLKLIQLITLFSFLSSPLFAEISKIPTAQKKFLDRYCLDCHDQDTMKGDVSLDFSKIDWNSHESKELWEKVLEVTHEGTMPPKKKKKQPTQTERNEL
ncbi:MAG: heme-binding domain-containing protein, partial [Lentisphaeraceae bacterium]|nr:heme-binding domain-containing protein [Lentisphaeraceae bacterium]